LLRKEIGKVIKNKKKKKSLTRTDAKLIENKYLKKKILILLNKFEINMFLYEKFL
jgi:hypothetical protein